MRHLAALLLALPVLLPVTPDASEGVSRDPGLVACTHLKGALRRLHRTVRDVSENERRALQQALLELYQTDRQLGCSFGPRPQPEATSG